MILSIILGYVTSILTAFWGWIVAGGLGLLAFMFSPTLRKYTIAALTVAAIIGSMYFYGYNKGYNAEHPVTPPACSEFRKVLVTGPATDKTIRIFERKGLCL